MRKSKYTKIIRITDEDHNWIRQNRGKKSMAGFLEKIIKSSWNRK